LKGGKIFKEMAKLGAQVGLAQAEERRAGKLGRQVGARITRAEQARREEARREARKKAEEKRKQIKETQERLRGKSLSDYAGEYEDLPEWQTKFFRSPEKIREEQKQKAQEIKSKVDERIDFAKKKLQEEEKDYREKREFLNRRKDRYGSEEYSQRVDDARDKYQIEKEYWNTYVRSLRQAKGQVQPNKIIDYSDIEDFAYRSARAAERKEEFKENLRDKGYSQIIGTDKFVKPGEVGLEDAGSNISRRELERAGLELRGDELYRTRKVSKLPKGVVPGTYVDPSGKKFSMTKENALRTLEERGGKYYTSNRVYQSKEVSTPSYINQTPLGTQYIDITKPGGFEAYQKTYGTPVEGPIEGLKVEYVERPSGFFDRAEEDLARFGEFGRPGASPGKKFLAGAGMSLVGTGRFGVSFGKDILGIGKGNIPIIPEKTAIGLGTSVISFGERLTTPGGFSEVGTIVKQEPGRALGFIASEALLTKGFESALRIKDLKKTRQLESLRESNIDDMSVGLEKRKGDVSDLVVGLKKEGKGARLEQMLKLKVRRIGEDFYQIEGGKGAQKIYRDSLFFKDRFLEEIPFTFSGEALKGKKLFIRRSPDGTLKATLKSGKDILPVISDIKTILGKGDDLVKSEGIFFGASKTKKLKNGEYTLGFGGEIKKGKFEKKELFIDLIKRTSSTREEVTSLRGGINQFFASKKVKGKPSPDKGRIGEVGNVLEALGIKNVQIQRQKITDIERAIGFSASSATEKAALSVSKPTLKVSKFSRTLPIFSQKQSLKLDTTTRTTTQKFKGKKSVGTKSGIKPRFTTKTKNQFVVSSRSIQSNLSRSRFKTISAKSQSIASLRAQKSRLRLRTNVPITTTPIQPGRRIIRPPVKRTRRIDLPEEEFRIRRRTQTRRTPQAPSTVFRRPTLAAVGLDIRAPQARERRVEATGLTIRPIIERNKKRRKGEFLF